MLAYANKLPITKIRKAIVDPHLERWRLNFEYAEFEMSKVFKKRQGADK